VSLYRLSYPGPMKADQFRLYRSLNATEAEAVRCQWTQCASTNYEISYTCFPFLNARTVTLTSSPINTELPPSRCITSDVAIQSSGTTMVHSLCVLVVTATLVASAVVPVLYGKWGLF